MIVKFSNLRYSLCGRPSHLGHSLSRKWGKGHDTCFVYCCKSELSWNSKVKLTKEACDELTFWSDNVEEFTLIVASWVIRARWWEIRRFVLGGGHGGLRYCGIGLFSCGISVILVLTCGIAVSSSSAVCGFSSFWLTVFGEIGLFTVLRYRLFALSFRYTDAKQNTVGHKGQ